MRSDTSAWVRGALALACACAVPGCSLDWSGLRTGRDGAVTDTPEGGMPAEAGPDVRGTDATADVRDVSVDAFEAAVDAVDVMDASVDGDAMPGVDAIEDVSGDGTDVTDASTDAGGSDARDVIGVDARDVQDVADVVSVDVPVLDAIDVGVPDVADDTPVDVPGIDTGSDDACVPALVVNEVQVAGPGGSGDEFVEIYNAGTCDVLLNNWSLRYRSSAGTSDVNLWRGGTTDVLPAGGFWVVGGQGFTGTANARIASSSSGVLAGAAGGVALYSPTGGLPTDSMGYGTATNAFVETRPAPQPPAGSSASRSPNGQDTNDNGADFVVSTPSTPGVVNN